MFLLAAAGKINNALIISMPIHFIDNITIIAMITTNRLSNNLIFISLLLAKDSFILIACNLLNANNQRDCNNKGN